MICHSRLRGSLLLYSLGRDSMVHHGAYSVGNAVDVVQNLCLPKVLPMNIFFLPTLVHCVLLGPVVGDQQYL